MEVLKMENSVLFFDDACRETYRLLKEEGLIKKENKEEKYITIEEICKAIKDCRHNTEFYFQCGVAAANIAANINTVRNYSDLSIAIDGYNMYKDFICLEDNFQILLFPLFYNLGYYLSFAKNSHS